MSLLADLQSLRRVYRRVALGDVARLWRRRAMLPTGRLLMPRMATHPRRDTPVVISLTTLPSRIGRINRTLNSLIDQTHCADTILLCVPEMSRREQCAYVLPEGLQSHPLVKIVCSEDYGPATKLLPALEHVAHDDTLIIAVDDDTIYPPDFIATFIAQHVSRPDAALCLRGWRMPASLSWPDVQVTFGTMIDEPEPVDVITGTWGYAVQPRFFDASVADYTLAPREAFFVDDVWISGHLARRGVDRYVVPCKLPPMTSLLTRVGGLTFGENRDGGNDTIVMRAFADDWRRAPRYSSRSA